MPGDRGRFGEADLCRAPVGWPRGDESEGSSALELTDKGGGEDVAGGGHQCWLWSAL